LSQQYYDQPPYPPPPPDYTPKRRWFGLDSWTIGVIGLTAVAGATCLCAVSVLCLLVFTAPPPAPATPRPVTNPTAIAAAGSPQATSAPTLNSADVGKFVNPSISAQLQGMTVLQIDVRDEATGNYVRAQQLTGSDLTIFAEAFNVSVKTVAPSTDCPDHVRLSITRSDNSVVTIGVCLKDVVILRGGIPELGGADLPMAPRFTDALAPYLPEAYRNLLRF
jgi:hypothetical protein